MRTGLPNDLFGYPLDRKVNPNDDGYVKALKWSADANLLPRAAVMALKDYALTQQDKNPMSTETAYMRNLLGLSIPKSVTAEEASRRARGDYFEAFKQFKLSARTPKLDWVTRWSEDSPADLKKTRHENARENLAKVKQKWDVLRAGDRAAKESK